MNDDGFVTPLDALLIINALNTGLVITPELPEPFVPVRYIDVNGSGQVPLTHCWSSITLIEAALAKVNCDHRYQLRQ